MLWGTGCRGRKAFCSMPVILAVSLCPCAMTFPSTSWLSLPSAPTHTHTHTHTHWHSHTHTHTHTHTGDTWRLEGAGVDYNSLGILRNGHCSLPHGRSTRGLLSDLHCEKLAVVLKLTEVCLIPYIQVSWSLLTKSFIHIEPLVTYQLLFKFP